MKKKSTILMVCVLMLSMLAAGCTSGGKENAAESPSAPPASSNAASNEPDANSGADPSKLPSGTKIGIASREILNDYNRGIIAGAQSAIEAAGGSVIVVDGQSDPGKHNENITNLINSGVKGIVVSLGDAQQLAPVVAKANEAGIPVVTTAIGAQVEGTVSDVGGDEPLMASMMARALLSSINYKGDVYVFWVPGAPLLETRKRVLEAIVADYPQVKLHEVPTEHNPARVQVQMQDILTANPKKGSVAGVWVAYDLLATGASEAIRQAGRNEIKMAAIDGDLAGFQMLFQENSPFVATVSQDVNYMGQVAAEALIQAINGHKDQIPRALFTTAFVATQKNGVAAAEKRWGTEFWDKVRLNKADIESKFPQTEQVVVVKPVVP
ncbi:substrate-binding domain-containing protein [Cohnella caldifontis]|uniref:substrate-binding domain-containing protein n=1 Tax=Cohnella caldifontis TaxID=3027471 RepID=UPI0023EC39C6|nr:substrate-binding domain-containing protein [Cohnella sp. YIM B05605]